MPIREGRIGERGSNLITRSELTGVQQETGKKSMKLILVGLTASSALMISFGALATDGKEIYSKSCALCHGSLSPKLVGDKAAWEPRIKQGSEALVASVMKGKGAMPAKGGNANLTEADAKAAVEYMLTAIK